MAINYNIKYENILMTCYNNILYIIMYYITLTDTELELQ